MNKSITIEMLKELQDSMNRPPEPFIEIYPLSWKTDKELKEICEARIKNGMGMWSTPFEEEDTDREK